MESIVPPSQPLEQHPKPPQDFKQRELSIIEISNPLFRIHDQEYSALHFSRSGTGRFDGVKQDYGICYTGLDEYVAFIECFGRTLGNRAVEESALNRKLLSLIASKNPLRIADITGNSLTKIGADARISTGSYLTSRAWANAIFKHPSKPDGIYYRSRHDDSKFCCGLFDSAKDQLVETSLGNLLQDHRQLLGKILDHYYFALI